MAVRDSEQLAASINSDLAAIGHPMCVAASEAGGGLGLFATRAIASGERVLIERPLIVAPREDTRAFICATCLADSRFGARASRMANGLQARWPRRCKGCNTLRFCSAACEAQLERQHRRSCECAALAAIAREERAMQQPVVSAAASDMLATAIRMLADRHAATCAESYAGFTASFQDYARRLVSADRPAAQPLMEEAVHAALRFVPGDARIPADALLDAISCHDANVVGVVGRGGVDGSRASFVGCLHLCNHSCAPNLAFDCMPLPSAAPEDAPSWDSPTPSFALVSLRPISAGEELCISYVSTDSEKAERQALLRSRFAFECKCPRCLSDETTDLAIGESMAAGRCTHADCGTGHAVFADPTDPSGKHWRCVHCGRLDTLEPATV